MSFVGYFIILLIVIVAIAVLFNMMAFRNQQKNANAADKKSQIEQPKQIPEGQTEPGAETAKPDHNDDRSYREALRRSAPEQPQPSVRKEEQKEKYSDDQYREALRAMQQQKKK